MAIARERRKTAELVEELKGLIRARYPEARFRVTAMPEGEGSALWTYADADLWDLTEVTADAQFEMMVHDKKFIFVVPMPLEAYRG